MILRVGLTGGIASGKSTVGRILAGLGCFVVDADRVVGELYRPGAPGHKLVVEHYGNAILNARGEIDRQKLASIAFRSERETMNLNRLIHPLVIAYESRLIENEAQRFPDQNRIVVVEATLLLESGGKNRYDKIVVVDADRAAQMRWGVARGMTRADLKRRIARQMQRDERLALADYIVRNDGDLDQLQAETVALFTRLEQDLLARRREEG